MNIEKAKNSNAGRLTELTIRSKSHWGYSKTQILEWTDELTITPEYIYQNQVYILTNNNKWIGFYAYQPLNRTKVKLNFLFIEPEYIGKGYGKILMDDFFMRIETTGFNFVTLDADPNVKDFYERLDFKVIGQLESSIKNRFLPIMEKQLKPVYIKKK